MSDGGLWYHFTQQRLKGWPPAVPALWAVFGYLIFGALFLVLGALLLDASWSVVEHAVDYTDIAIDPVSRVGTMEVVITRDMVPPIYLEYELEGFYQNFRRYVQNQDQKQLSGAFASANPDDLGACAPFNRAPDGRPSYPCGLPAWSLFNDTYALEVEGPPAVVGALAAWRRLAVDSSAETIAWLWASEFRNVDPEAPPPQAPGVAANVAQDMWILRRYPPVVCEQVVISAVEPFHPVEVATRREFDPVHGLEVEVADCRNYMSGQPSCRFQRGGLPFACLGPDYREVRAPNWGVESGHFIVWMRLAGLRKFRKLWGQVDEPLRAGSRVRLHVQDNFPVASFGGRKAFILTTTTELGGRNDLLGYGYMSVGLCCLVLGVRKFLARRRSRARSR